VPERCGAVWQQQHVLSGGVELRERSVRVLRTQLADMRKLWDTDAHLRKRGVVGVGGVHGSGLRTGQHTKLHGRQADVRLQLQVGQLRIVLPVWGDFVQWAVREHQKQPAELRQLRHRVQG